MAKDLDFHFDVGSPAAYQHGLALALPEVVRARPTGLEPATFGSGTQRSIH